MGDKTVIEWTDATWNPVGGCSIHSPGCTNCYAQRLAVRHPDHPVYKGVTSPSKAGPVFNGRLNSAPLDHPVWRWPLQWRGSKNPVMGAGQSSLIFVGDMSDLYHENRPIGDIIHALAVAALDRRHIHQHLTKRAARLQKIIADPKTPEMVAEAMWVISGHRTDHITGGWPLQNLWLGVSAERQKEADERREDLKATPAAVRFVSYEPALGPVDWTGWEFVDQIISGGESGSSARPSHPNWHRTTRDFCAANGIAYFFKQWGEFKPISFDDLASEEIESEELAGRLGGFDDQPMHRVGKKRAGRLLDGQEHSAFPNTSAKARAA